LVPFSPLLHPVFDFEFCAFEIHVIPWPHACSIQEQCSRVKIGDFDFGQPVAAVSISRSRFQGDIAVAVCVNVPALNRPTLDIFGSDFLGVLYGVAFCLPLDIFGDLSSIPRFEHRIALRDVLGNGWRNNAFMF
jgi:hypothetical protein